MDKIWKDIIGYEGLYKISNLCEIVSLQRTVYCKNGYPKTIPEKKLKIMVNNKGYARVSLLKNSQRKSAAVHRLMAIHFIPNPLNLPLVRHNDDNKLNNQLSNLCWGTNKDNSMDMVRRNRQASGSRNGMYGKSGILSPNYGMVKEKNPLYGKKGEQCNVSKIIINTQTGIFYYGIKEAADSIGSKYSTLASKLSGHDRNNTPFIYA
jgi:NUMOD4 motif/HNH endonuclease